MFDQDRRRRRNESSPLAVSQCREERGIANPQAIRDRVCSTPPFQRRTHYFADNILSPMNPLRRTILIQLIAAAIIPASLVAFSMIAQSAVAQSFTAVVAIVVALPPLFQSMQRASIRLLSAMTAVVVIALLLLLMPASWPQWFGVAAIIGSVAMLLAGVARFVQSPTAIIVAMLLWVSWPIWLAGHLAGHETLVNCLAAAHPLLAINGQLLDQAIWTERPMMYGWTALNQDVPFSIPTTALWCVLMHGGIGALLLIISRWLEQKPALA
jgi:hypothetical protein